MYNDNISVVAGRVLFGSIANIREDGTVGNYTRNWYDTPIPKEQIIGTHVTEVVYIIKMRRIYV